MSRRSSDRCVGVARHPGLAESRAPFAGAHLNARQVAPRRYGRACADSGDAQGSCLSTVRNVVTRSERWRDTKRGCGVSTGQTGNGSRKVLEIAFGLQKNLYGGARYSTRTSAFLRVNRLAVGGVAGARRLRDGLGEAVPQTCARAVCSGSVGHVLGGDAFIGTGSPHGRDMQEDTPPTSEADQALLGFCGLTRRAARF